LPVKNKKAPLRDAESSQIKANSSQATLNTEKHRAEYSAFKKGQHQCYHTTQKQKNNIQKIIIKTKLSPNKNNNLEQYMQYYTKIGFKKI
jgi:hypothetical protein